MRQPQIRITIVQSKREEIILSDHTNQALLPLREGHRCLVYRKVVDLNWNFHQAVFDGRRGPSRILYRSAAPIKIAINQVAVVPFRGDARLRPPKTSNAPIHQPASE